jgi:hypothetical protein
MSWTGLPKIVEQDIIPEPNSGCWIWVGAFKDKKTGYGSVSWRKKAWAVHRLVFTLLRKRISKKLDIDHLCRNPGCCNPDHLEPVTRGENIRRGVGVAPNNLRKTHCPQGHEYTPENTYFWAKQRFCRACSRVYKKNYEIEKKHQEEMRQIRIELWDFRSDDWNYAGP